MEPNNKQIQEALAEQELLDKEGVFVETLQMLHLVEINDKNEATLKTQMCNLERNKKNIK